MPVNIIQPTNRDEAMAFVQADTNRLAKKSYRNYKREHRAQDKKFDKNIERAIFAAPVVAAASDLLLRKGAKAAVKSGALWSAGLVAPIAVFAANNILTSSSKKAQKAENKHPGMTMGGLVVSSYMGYEAITAGIEKLALNKRVNNVADTIVNGAKETINKVRPELKLPEKISKTAADVMTFVKTKTPDVVKNAYKTVKNSPKTADILKSSKSFGVKALAAAPVVLVTGALGAIIGKAVEDGVKYSAVKNETKNAQFQTAKELLKVYDIENKDLKAENELLQSQQSEEV